MKYAAVGFLVNGLLWCAVAGFYADDATVITGLWASGFAILNGMAGIASILGLSDKG